MLAASTLATAQERNSCPTDRPHTLYSRFAHDIHSTRGAILSPDGKKSVRAWVVDAPKDPDGLEVAYEVRVGGRKFRTRLHGWDSEVSWSPDSSAFAVTETEGGGGIGYRVYVFYIQEKGLHKIDVSSVVEKAAGKSPGCEIKIYPNTAVIAWLTATRILVAAQTIPVSICQCSGAFSAYEVNLPDLDVVAHYSQRDVKHRFWNLLGCELRDADNKCFVRSQ